MVYIKNKISLTGNLHFDNLLLILISIRLKELSAEVGTYHFLIKDTQALNYLYVYFDVERIDLGLNTNKLWDVDTTEIIDKCIKERSNIEYNVYVDINGRFERFNITNSQDAVIASHIIAGILIEDEDLILTLTKFYKNLDKFKVKVKDVEVREDGKKYVKSLLCKSFDDFQPIYASREVLYESNTYYIVKNSVMVYK